MYLIQRINKIIKRFYTFLISFRFIIFIYCEIETPQFLGSQEKYYMFKQSGWYNIINRKFHTDHRVNGSHDVSGFKSFRDFKKRVVKYL